MKLIGIIATTFGLLGFAFAVTPSETATHLIEAHIPSQFKDDGCSVKLMKRGPGFTFTIIGDDLLSLRANTSIDSKFTTLSATSDLVKIVFVNEGLNSIWGNTMEATIELTSKSATVKLLTGQHLETKTCVY